MKLMNLIANYGPAPWFGPVASGGGGSAGTLTQLLSLGTELFTWLITQMGALLTFMFANPLVLVPLVIMIAGLVVGMLGRIWGSIR